ncbi:diadenylate cyclase CdaA [Rhodohalobacter mucosus]|uniref:Diadenylate cyclase n=1 Tax=Rhodohalobacter mucosus TaxID=2079485 RepID=A0A316TMF7_9BACT|nr:diadenylate cyclase CdaA [Rhodohalobacter mucosus]PWN05590.1 TIGR00159 family protein [Rhodohalobacter mucosus]
MIPIAFLEYGLKDLLETLVIATMLYYLYRWIRGTFAIQAALGLVFIIVVNAVVSLLGFTTLNFMLRSVVDVGVLAVFIIFQPEIRKLLYSLGQNTSFDRLFGRSGSEGVVEEVIAAVKNMAQTKTGALIVFARSSSLQDLVDVGVRIDAQVNAQLIQTIFQKDTPLHDGAIVIRSGRIVAASCYLPISQNPNISSVFGTRHRAAVGVSETNNVFVVIVSEETGRISVAKNGGLTSGLSIQKLRAEMEKSLGEDKEEEMGFSAEKAELEMN